MLLPDVTIEDHDSNERGVSLWVFIADQGYDVDPVHGQVYKTYEDSDSTKALSGPLNDLFWYDSEDDYEGDIPDYQYQDETDIYDPSVDYFEKLKDAGIPVEKTSNGFTLG